MFTISNLLLQYLLIQVWFMGICTQTLHQPAYSAFDISEHAYPEVPSRHCYKARKAEQKSKELTT